jgi:hypothetical protein
MFLAINVAVLSVCSDRRILLQGRRKDGGKDEENGKNERKKQTEISG